MTADEVLKQMQIAATLQSENPVCVIDAQSRTITVPEQYKLLGVENDKRVERIYFQCPKIVGDNQDLSQDYQLFVNYQNANGDPDAYHIDDMEVDGDNITFSWLLEENVTKYRGNIQFAFGAIKPGNEAEDPDKNRWNTTINTDCTCLVGLKCTQQVAESNPDALAQIWAAIDELKTGGGASGEDGREVELQNNGTAIQWRYVGDSSWMDLVQLSDLKGEGIPEGGTTGQVLTKKSDADYDAEWTAVEEGNPSGRGWTSEQVTMLETLGQYLVYTDQTTGQSILDGLISSLRESSGGTTEPGVYTITKELTNVTIDNTSTSVTSGSIYAANLTASEGYYIESVTITMGGENITSSAYTDGVINITSVTGNIVIVAIGTQLDNLIALSECTSGNESMPDGAKVIEGEFLVTPFLEVDGSLIYKTNINRNLPTGSQYFNQKCYMYDSDKTYIRVLPMNANVSYGEMSDFGLDATAKYVRIMFKVENENPYFGLKGIV